MILSIGLALFAAAPALAQDRAPTAGRSISTLAGVPLKSRNGAPITLGSRIVPGKPTLIAFWASWCGPCYAEAPHLNRIRKQLGERYNFIYINRREGDPDPDQTPAWIARFLAYGGMTDVDYVIADVAAYRRILGKDIATVPEGRVGIPRVYLFDRNGRQIYMSHGFAESDGPELERLVKQAVAER
ncbi:TlpA disulfide reductase family protein [Sphingomonas sp. AOB5]|uniref:TlpA family protein disulfide reductase n=1 Tax=Sphingomonas sp. AOB5 TaxID=3034017 RepID=UPI0023F838C7|nr:TlpA disulfide reductase family protein [Sphingomonas sp. AOB5]MDF7774927.1 TlpA disulfide reductase family protein [Sphingomonas sp. AOB5]